MNAKYYRLQEKIQMVSNQNKNPTETEDQFSSIESSKKLYSFKATLPIPHFAKLEIRLKSLEDLFESSMENIEMKHEALQEYISKIKATIDSSEIVYDKDRDEQINQIYSSENSLMIQVADESNAMDAYIENALRKTETIIIQIDNKMNQDTEIERKECELVLDNGNKDIEGISTKLDELNQEQKMANDQLTKEISDRFNEINERIKCNEKNNIIFYNNQSDKMKQIRSFANQINQDEGLKRDEFKNNIIKVLNETEESLNKY